MGSLASKMMEDVDFTGKNGHWWLIHLIFYSQVGS
jgi:hypothetical protein